MLGTPVSTLLFVPILAYGILRSQLFDIDLKVKWTLRRSTLAAVLAISFFVAKEGLEALLPIEGIIPNIASAALVTLVAYPAWRLAGRLTDRIMPHVDASSAYLDERKAAIYRAQIEEAFADGILSARDRRLLARLQESLGLDGRVAKRLEREVSVAAQEGEARGNST